MNFFMIENLNYLISMSLVLSAIPLMIVKTLVRILQKSQENGQKRANTNTGTEEHAKSQEEAIKKSTIGQALVKS
ncbi:hypothetical protein Tco_1421975 [Tanacetum coccineum]